MSKYITFDDIVTLIRVMFTIYIMYVYTSETMKHGVNCHKIISD